MSINPKFQSPIFWVAIIGAIKIVLDTIGITIIDNTKVDALANGAAAVIAIAGIFIDHGVKATQPTSQAILDGLSKLSTDLQPIVSPPAQPKQDPEEQTS